jgi:hypothetical protein
MQPVKLFFVLGLLFNLLACNQEDFFHKEQVLQLPEVELPTLPPVIMPEVPVVLTTEVFHQAAHAGQLDIVWIIDDSKSMTPLQDNLAQNFATFIRLFIVNNVDFKMAITTTDVTAAKRGLMVKDSDILLNADRARHDPTQFIEDFKRLVMVGIKGNGTESGLEASKAFMERYAADFLRPDAYLAVIILSDEEDQSVSSVGHYLEVLRKQKINPGLVKIYSIVDVFSRREPGEGRTIGSARYIEAAKRTSGISANIFDNFHHVLGQIGENLFVLMDSFPLGNLPVPASIKVSINDVLTENFTYAADSNSIKFKSGFLPPEKAEIKVIYRKQ